MMLKGGAVEGGDGRMKRRMGWDGGVSAGGERSRLLYWRAGEEAEESVPFGQQDWQLQGFAGPALH